jgi:glucokinase
MTRSAAVDLSSIRGGIDLGGTKILAVVMDSRGKVLGHARNATPMKGGPPAIIREMATTLTQAASEAGLRPQQLVGAGVGAPGAADAKTGTLSHAGNLDGWEKPFPLSSRLSAIIGTPVFLGNDVQVAVSAEHQLGAGRGHKSMIGVWWGTGIGGGLILDEKPWLGAGAAGEIGHLVVRHGGARCGCGRRGCLEAYAGRAAMERRARVRAKRGEPTILFDLMKKKGRERLVSGIWFRAIEKGDPLAIRLVDRAVEMLGTGIASAINVLDVETVVIGGGLGTRLGQPYADRIGKAMVPHLKVPERPRKVVVAALGEYSGALGAALLATPA